MANIELWIQLQNHALDLVTGHLDRMTGHHFPHVAMTLTSPVTGDSRPPNMHNPLGEDALILRRYTATWAAPDDRKVNPWDLNELDPTDNGTMGTIPGRGGERRPGADVQQLLGDPGLFPGSRPRAAWSAVPASAVDVGS